MIGVFPEDSESEFLTGLNEDVARGVAWRDLCRLFSKFIRKKLGAAAGWESLRVGVAAVRNVKE